MQAADHGVTAPLMRKALDNIDRATELKNANGYVSALRHRTWAQARPHLK